MIGLNAHLTRFPQAWLKLIDHLPKLPPKAYEEIFDSVAWQTLTPDLLPELRKRVLNGPLPSRAMAVEALGHLGDLQLIEIIHQARAGFMPEDPYFGESQDFEKNTENALANLIRQEPQTANSLIKTWLEHPLELRWLAYFLSSADYQIEDPELVHSLVQGLTNADSVTSEISSDLILDLLGHSPKELTAKHLYPFLKHANPELVKAARMGLLRQKDPIFQAQYTQELTANPSESRSYFDLSVELKMCQGPEWLPLMQKLLFNAIQEESSVSSTHFTLALENVLALSPRLSLPLIETIKTSLQKEREQPTLTKERLRELDDMFGMLSDQLIKSHKPEYHAFLLKMRPQLSSRLRRDLEKQFWLQRGLDTAQF
jgi:hypothetical protein